MFTQHLLVCLSSSWSLGHKSCFYLEPDFELNFESGVVRVLKLGVHRVPLQLFTSVHLIICVGRY